MPFGQIVIGPPGSGKTTYCNGIQQFLELVGRKTAVINMDPANDHLPYKCTVNIEELVTHQDAMEEYSLGPNGGLLFCMDYVSANMDWLEKRLEPIKDDHYLLFDFPGQVELFTLADSVKKIIQILVGKWDFRLCCVHLVDAHLLSNTSKYISALLLSLATMLHLELPHVNVLSKVDLLEQYGELAFNLDFYTDVLDLQYLVEREAQNSAFSAKYRKLSAALCEVVQDFGLVNFCTLNIQDKESVLSVMRVVDKANGCVFGDLERVGLASPIGFANFAATTHADWDYYRSGEVQERYMNDISDEDVAKEMRAIAAAAAATRGEDGDTLAGTTKEERGRSS
eukprot:jgi/Mesvir1/1929/Mv22955-RA.1